MMLGLDPSYALLMLIGLPLVFLPQLWVKNTVAKYSDVATQGGMKGVDVAREILQQNGIQNVDVEQVDGFLSDHYDPTSRTVRLSSEIYQGTSVSSVAIAAHEVGHAIQHARGFYPVVLRSAMVPAVNLGSQLGPLLIIFSLILMSMRMLSPDLGIMVAMIGVVGYGLAVAFHFVTLPVEIDASSRAMGILKQQRFLAPAELNGARWVLIAAASTYVATALYALMHLIYYLMQILGASRRD